MKSMSFRTGRNTAAISALRESLPGRVLTPEDGGYEQARRIWNATADRKPAVIVRCAGVADVQQALGFALEGELPVAVRGGGHSLPGFSTCEDGMVIDLGPMKGITVDSQEHVARAEAGLTLAEFDQATQEHGLATTLGVASTTGIAGLTLGGGLGWLMRKHGLACDNLRSVELVTADGALVTASADQNAELFWGLKGGGGNFGIATSFEYGLHPVGPTVFGGLVAYAPESRRDLLRFYRDLTQTAPDELTTYAALTNAPDGAPVAAMAACYAGAVEEGERLLGPARSALGAPVLDALGPLLYTDQQKLLDAAYPPGQYHYWKSCFLDDLTDEVIDVLAERFAATQAPPLLEIVVEHMGGAIAAGDCAFGHRDARYDVLIDANWIDPADGERCIAWARETAAALEPHTRGGYVNYEPKADEEEVRAAYGDRYARLRSLKSRYDPQNVFRLNQNIAPEG
jgi:FAD/FMN-containing dehydrogenase